VRRVVELHWPALLVASACAGLGASNWVHANVLGPSPADVALGVLALAALAATWVFNGLRRAAAVGVLLAILGLSWGAMRLDALERSPLSAEIGGQGRAELVVVGAPRRTTWAVRAPAEVVAFAGRRLRERVLLVLPLGRAPPRGAILEAGIRIAEPRTAEKGGFDERAWLERQGIHVVARARSWEQVGTRGGVAGFGDRLRERIEAAVGRGATGVRRVLVLGVVLGEDEGLPEGVRDDFRASGLAHLLAVSGQNVAFIAGGIFVLGWLVRLHRALCELLVLAAIAAYVLVVGWQPSVVRAGIAGALVSLAWLLARPRDRWHFLAVGALILLAWMPGTLLEPGFQLSFAAVVAIYVGLPRIRELADGYPIPRGLADVLGIAFACGLATAPIVLLHFGTAPVYTVPANALAAPALPLVLGLGLLAAAADPVSPTAAAALAWLAGWAAAWLELVARLVASLPGAEIGARSALVVAGAVVAFAAAARRSRGTLVPSFRSGSGPLALLLAGSAVLAVAVAWSFRAPPTWIPPAGFRATFLDVGQGDAILLETASARVLVDQGPPEADVAGQLRRLGIPSLSALVLTHPQRDHVGGAADVLRELRVGTVLDPALAATGPEHAEAVAAAREHSVPVRAIRAGAEFRVGGLLLDVLWPDDAGTPHEDPNLNAAVLVASYGELDVLLPADAESDVTSRLPLGAVEILKVAHHGSADPGLEDELRVLRPQVAVISAGRGNDYGHPRAETLAALATVPGLAVYRTDRDGRVVVESDGRGLRVRTGS
jgi:competence protein ComEC